MKYFWVITLQRAIEGRPVRITAHGSRDVDTASTGRREVFESVLAEVRADQGIPEYVQAEVLFYLLQPDRLGLPS